MRKKRNSQLRADNGVDSTGDSEIPQEPVKPTMSSACLGSIVMGVAQRIKSGIELCGRHPFVTGLFALLSIVGLLLSIISYRLDRKEAISATAQVQRVEDKIDKISSSVDTPSLTLDHESGVINKYWKHLRYSFTRDEYVNPRIVQELTGWISDSAASVTQIDLVEANRSNRFYASPVIRRIRGRDWVFANSDSDGPFFAYRYIGSSPSGIHMLECMENTGGRSIFYTLILLTLTSDKSIDPRGNGTQMRERVMLKTLGSIVLGDRYDGEITYDGRALRIGADQSMMKHGRRLKEEIIPVK